MTLYESRERVPISNKSTSYPTLGDTPLWCTTKRGYVSKKQKKSNQNQKSATGAYFDGEHLVVCYEQQHTRNNNNKYYLCHSSDFLPSLAEDALGDLFWGTRAKVKRETHCRQIIKVVACCFAFSFSLVLPLLR